MMKKILLLITVMLACQSAYAQLYSGVLDAQRATDNWASAGVVGGIPTPARTCANLTTSDSLATINTAISNCSSGASTVGVVNLAAGTYNLAGAINLKSWVVLKGAGQSTILNLTNKTGSNWIWGGGSGMLTMIGPWVSWSDGTPPMEGVNGTSKTWSGTNGSAGTYTKGATVLNMGADTTGLAVGDELVCNQTDVPDGSLPSSGYFVSDKTGVSNAIAWTGSYEDMGAAMEQRSRVTALGGSGNRNVTIADPLSHPTGTWETGRTPVCGWLKEADMIKNVGLESLQVKTTGYTSAQDCVICIAFAYNAWVKNVGIVPYYKAFHLGGATNFVVAANDSLHVEIRDNWMSRAQGGGASTTTTYGIVLQWTFSSKVENNIFDNVESPMLIAGGGVGNVYSYNFENFVGDDGQEGGIQHHEPGAVMNLVEGNRAQKIWNDIQHGNSLLSTFYRNHLSGSGGGGIDTWSYNRWMAYIGNVLNCSTAYQSLPTDVTKRTRFVGVCFRMGYPQENASSATTNGVAYDLAVGTTSMRWGNYTQFDTTIRWDSSEVPTADALFPNAEPASHTLPASFIYSVSPAWWPTGKTWPIIGPDVTGGNVSSLGGHANTTPAEDCYAAAGGLLASFSPSTCYDGGGAGQGGGSPAISGYNGRTAFMAFLLLLLSLSLPLLQTDKSVLQHQYRELTRKLK